MRIPVDVSFRGIPVSDAVAAAAARHADRLERFFDRITDCRVVIESPHHHHHKGRLYCVRVDVTVPGKELVVNREHRFDHAHEDVYVALRDAFRAMRRELQDHARCARGDVKAHEGPLAGRISRVAPDGDFGFIVTPEGREIYFNRHALIAENFGRLRPGDRVQFAEEPGDQGPQASSIRLLHPYRRGRAGPESTS